MTRPWLGAYPDGVPHDIDPGAYRSLVELMDESFGKFGARSFPVALCPLVAVARPLTE